MLDSQMNLEAGDTALVNHGGPGVAFTSYYDDSRKGNTNDAADGQTGLAGDWLGIWDNATTQYTWTNIYFD
jgi:hypothetical protein